MIRDSVDSSRARFGQFEALTHAYREESLCYHSEGMADILRILIGINRSLYNREHVFAKAQKPSVLSNALHYIDLNLSGDLSLDTVAKALFIDKYNFPICSSRICRSAFTSMSSSNGCWKPNGCS